MLSLQLTNESLNRMEVFFERMAAFPSLIKDDIFSAVFDVYGKLIDKEFEEEGYPQPWKPLSLVTVMDKAALGYYTGILVREGFLWRSLSELEGSRTGFVKEFAGVSHVEMRPIQTGNVLEETTLGQDHWKWEFRTLDERFYELEVERPMTPENDVWEQFMTPYENDLFQLIERKAQF